MNAPSTSTITAPTHAAAARIVKARSTLSETDIQEFNELIAQCAGSLDPQACSECEALASDTQPLTPIDSQNSHMDSKLNWLRAGVLGANDGIVSTASLVAGVAGATANSTTLLISGIAGVVAGGLSMAAGEYVSVSTQRDAERAALTRQRHTLAKQPYESERHLARLIMNDGVSKVLAQRVARELTENDPLAAHAKFELGINPDELTNPWHAALASMISFVLGAIIPLCAIVFTPHSIALPFTVFAVTLALAITGSVSAYLGQASIARATIRNILWGNIAMIVTYGVGLFVGNIT